MIDVSGYRVTDPFFGAPYIDEDEERTDPVPHRHVHGGFQGTDTRFQFSFPPEEQWQGRMFNPLSGAHGGDEKFFSTPLGEMIGGLGLSFRLGGYMVQSNQGHIGDDIDPKGGEDPTLYGHRASAETARFSKFVAAQVYGTAPHHSYVFGGSGGGRRSPLCLENAPDAWDGALPFMGGGDINPRGSTKRIKGSQVMSFASMFNVQRLLGKRIHAVVDAMAAGGSGDPFAGLSTHEREELASLYRQGYPRGDEYNIAEPMGQIWLWTSIADLLVEQDPTYFENFWTKPGYVGHDLPAAVESDLVDAELTIKRVVTAADILSDPVFEAPEYTMLRIIIGITASSRGDMNMPYAVEIDGLHGYLLGAGVQLTSGAASGRQLYVSQVVGNLLMCDGHGDANLQRFSGAVAGDSVRVSNRKFLAFCYFARHHLMDDPQFDSFRLDGVPIFQQHPVPLMSPLMGVSYSGEYEGKLIWVHHTHDASLWPPQGVIYESAVRAAQGDDGAAARFRLRWTHNAEHIPPMMIPSSGSRATNTWLIDYGPVIEQTMVDLIDWVENGVEPAATNYEYVDGRVVLPETAADRGGIQPVVRLVANGGAKAEVGVGETVTLTVDAEMPPGAGSIISLEWDFDGKGSYPLKESGIDGSAAAVSRTITRSFDTPGTYFVTALAHGHRDGDVAATSRRLPNLAQARVVVR
ncbi:MAG: tannase/feruloyl esterase family alpha/beta hydrolase [Actinomycetota bacterium]|nr:tannase/feruloyl esterase family alpha/beta hydrolase [Actinomycetota bacterium]